MRLMKLDVLRLTCCPEKGRIVSYKRVKSWSSKYMIAASTTLILGRPSYRQESIHAYRAMDLVISIIAHVFS